MKIIVPKSQATKIFEAVRGIEPREIKGALYARFVQTDCYEIEDVYISRSGGTNVFSNLVVNFSYKRFERRYFKRHNFDYENHNYIGDWHSHPLFECSPSNYDSEEVYSELANSNANFLIQLIVKTSGQRLRGNCYLYKRGMPPEKCELIIEECADK